MKDVLEEARLWLRMNGDYNIKISLWGVYGCYSVEGTYLNNIICVHQGNTLSKHVLKALEDLKKHKEN